MKASLKPMLGVYAPHRPDMFAQNPPLDFNGIDTETVIAHIPRNVYGCTLTTTPLANAIEPAVQLTPDAAEHIEMFLHPFPYWHRIVQLLLRTATIW